MAARVRGAGFTAGLAVAVVAVQVAASAADKTYYLTQLTMSAYAMLVVLGLAMLMGYAGQASLGQAGFFAIGGYVAAFLTTFDLAPHRDALAVVVLERAHLLMTRPDGSGGSLTHVHPWAAALFAIGLAAAIAWLVAGPVFRLRGHYLAMATLGFGIIVYRIFLGSSLFGSADGISDVPALTLLPGFSITGRVASRVSNYYAAWVLVLLTLWMLTNLIGSRVGRALRAIHGSENAAAAVGIRIARFKTQVFVLAAALAAVAGVLLTHYNGGIGPSEASVMKSVRYVAIVAVGGMANLRGALVMGTVLTFLSLRGYFGTFDDLVFGGILLADHALRPRGDRRRRSVAAAAVDLLRGGSAVTMQPVLEVRDLGRRFGGLQAVADLSFTVPPGIIKAVIGPNGAGKTTLFNLVSGFALPDTGSVRFRGEEVRGLPTHELAARGMARTFQQIQLVPGMTVLENVLTGRHRHTRTGFLAGMLQLPGTVRESRAARERCLETLAFLGLADLADAEAVSLAYGQQRRVELARALVCEPSLLLLDEPAAGLNMRETEDLAGTIGRINGTGLTVLLVEHDMGLVMNISHEILVLGAGRWVAEGEPRAIQRNPDVIRIYLGEEDAEST